MQNYAKKDGNNLKMKAMSKSITPCLPFPALFPACWGGEESVVLSSCLRMTDESSQIVAFSSIFHEQRTAGRHALSLHRDDTSFLSFQLSELSQMVFKISPKDSFFPPLLIP